MENRFRNRRPQPRSGHSPSFCGRPASCKSSVSPLGTELSGMTLWCGSHRGLTSSQVLIAVAWFIFAALSAQCQSSPAAQVADCPTSDHQAAATGGEANDSIAAIGPVIQKV